MNERQRIVFWSGIIVLGLTLLIQGPRPTLFDHPGYAKPLQTQLAVATAAAEPLPERGYFEVLDGCGPYREGECLNIRSGPGTDFAVVHTLRLGAVLEYDGVVERDGHTWYRVVFNEWLRYPERAQREMYVAARYVRAFSDAGLREVPIGTKASSTKYILIDRGEQMLYAFEDGSEFMRETISTGIELTPTPRGIFHVYKKTPTRYMQGPLPGISEKVFDLPGVPWNLYFTAEGAVIHGAYWHDKFGEPWSNGCVNMPPEKARQLYEWAELGTKVIVRD